MGEKLLSFHMRCTFELGVDGWGVQQADSVEKGAVTGGSLCYSSKTVVKRGQKAGSSLLRKTLEPHSCIWALESAGRLHTEVTCHIHLL